MEALVIASQKKPSLLKYDTFTCGSGCMLLLAHPCKLCSKEWQTFLENSHVVWPVLQRHDPGDAVHPCLGGRVREVILQGGDRGLRGHVDDRAGHPGLAHLAQDGLTDVDGGLQVCVQDAIDWGGGIMGRRKLTVKIQSVCQDCLTCPATPQ